MVSVYNDDTNKDGFINLKDLRRLYLFDINGDRLNPLLPENYSVLKSEYDPENDFMYVFAKLDENQNGQLEDSEPIHIYWIDLNEPSRTGRQY
jgi:Ca2+-binding EF-hand superfamily protein